jgi:GNAT superfamily N-acetyltransferase
MTEPPPFISLGDVMVRRAGPADAAALGAMRAAQRRELHGGEESEFRRFEADCAAFFARELASGDPWLIGWIARAGAAPVGSSVLTLLPTLPRLGSRGTIDGRVRDVYVAPQYRRRGLGRALTLCVVEEARRRGVDRLALGTSTMGRPLYESLGFVAKDDEMVFVPRDS